MGDINEGNIADESMSLKYDHISYRPINQAVILGIFHARKSQMGHICTCSTIVNAASVSRLFSIRLKVSKIIFLREVVFMKQ